MSRVFNFNPGPATLPISVLEQAQAELLDYRGTGMSVMELSHRSKEFEAIVHQAESSVKELLGLGDNYRVLFLQGGASTQFSMIPTCFLTSDTQANYVITGSFAEKAYKEAKKLGATHVAASTKEDNHRTVPDQEAIALSDNPAYVHITTNNTIYGTQYHYVPDFGPVPLIADMSSDIMSKPFDANKFALIYAGAQKNLGPAGVTLVIIRRDMLERVPDSLPSMLRYDLLAENDSLYNTPPGFSIYMVSLMLEWIEANGGLAAMEQRNKEKAALVYAAIDDSAGFYHGHSQVAARSLMNVTFTLANPDLENQFLQEAKSHQMIGLKGHRSVGGIRASIYNAMPREGCIQLAQFMREFANKHS